MSSYYPNKQRPYGNVPIWATDETMTDPGQAWDGTPSKIRPSDGIIAAGFLPTEQPPAERVNWALNDPTRRLASLNLVEARTFVEPLGAAGTGATSAGVGNAVGWFAGARWQAVETIFHATNSTIVEKSIDGGYNWTTTLTVPSAVFSGIATRETALKAGATAASYTLTGVAKIQLTGGDVSTNNAWAPTTLTGSGTFNTAQYVIADPYEDDVFLVAGNDFITGSTTPVVWRVTAPLGVFGSQVKVTMGSPVAFFYPMQTVAASPDYKLACGWSGVINGLFRWQDGDTTATAVTSPTASEIKQLLWLPEDSLFLLIADAGPGVELWTSADGATGTWTQLDPVAGGTALFDAANGYLNGACVRGSIIMIPLSVSGTGHVAVSGDGGATWDIISDPIVRHSSSKVVQRICDLGPRFIAGGYNAASAVFHALTLRVG